MDWDKPQICGINVFNSSGISHISETPEDEWQKYDDDASPEYPIERVSQEKEPHFEDGQRDGHYLFDGSGVSFEMEKEDDSGEETYDLVKSFMSGVEGVSSTPSTSTNTDTNAIPHRTDFNFQALLEDIKELPSLVPMTDTDFNEPSKPNESNPCTPKRTENILDNAHDAEDEDQYEAEDEGYTCTECHSHYKRLDHLKRHLLFRHSEKGQHSCKQCSKSFRAKKELQTHFEIQHMGKRFICSQCPRTFKSAVGLRSHVSRVHNVTDVPHSSHTITAAPRSHQKGQYQCQNCNTTFDYSRSLERHKCIKGKKHECTFPGCSKAFKAKRYLNDHVEAIHSSPKQVCEICGQKFRHRNQRLQHKKVAHSR